MTRKCFKKMLFRSVWKSACASQSVIRA